MLKLPKPDKPEPKKILARSREGAKRINPMLVFFAVFAASRENSSHKLRRLNR